MKDWIEHEYSGAITCMFEVFAALLSVRTPAVHRVALKMRERRVVGVPHLSGKCMTGKNCTLPDAVQIRGTAVP